MACIYLFIDPELPGQELRWVLDGVKLENADLESAGLRFGTFTDFVSFYQQHAMNVEIIAVLSAHAVTCLNIDLPSKNKRQIINAIPFMVEDELVDSIDNLHMAVSKESKGKAVTVNIVDKEFMRFFHSWVLEHKLKLLKLVTQFDVFQYAENQAVVYLSAGYLLICCATHHIETNLDDLAFILPSLPFESIEKIQLLFDDTVDNYEIEILESRLAEHGYLVEKSGVGADILDYVAQHRDSILEKSTDLLQKEFSLAGDTHPATRYFLYGMVAAILCVAMQIAFNVSAGYYFNKRANAAMGVANEHYLNAFPEDGRVFDLYQQLLGKLRGARLLTGSNKFTLIFVPAADVVADLSRQGQVKIQQFRFDEADGDFKIDLRLGNISMVDSLKQKLESKGLFAQVVSANQDQGAVKASILVKLSQ